MKKLHLPLLVALSLLIFSSCRELPYYTEYNELPQSQWDSCDTFTFSIPKTERDRDVALAVAVRTTNRFAYRDIVACVDLLCDGRVLSSQALPVKVRNHPSSLFSCCESLVAFFSPSSTTGLAFNESHSRSQTFHLKAKHQYMLRIRHRMRANPLENVIALGIIVE